MPRAVGPTRGEKQRDADPRRVEGEGGRSEPRRMTRNSEPARVE